MMAGKHVACSDIEVQAQCRMAAADADAGSEHRKL